MIDGPHSALLTDLYQLTMLQTYFDEGHHDTAVFEFAVRRLPPGRNFLVAAGLEQVLEYLEQLRFTGDELQWLADCGRFRRPFVDFLAELRFTGDVHALPEGTVCFADEPLVRITAPLAEAQLVESRLINLLHYQTLLASKAARDVLAGGGKLLVEFGLRRAHGAEAALLAARAAYLAGFAGTSNVLAGALWGIPLYGTMAHSLILSHRDETEAFLAFARANPADVVLLIDTYDTEAGAEKVVQIARTLAAEGIKLRAVRLDSGDLAEHARRVRRILDAGGLSEVTIFASGNVDEFALAGLVASGAPIDGYGIGTRLDVSADAPYLDCAYKLQEYAGIARRKRSEGKATWPGRKQVHRRYDSAGWMAADIVTLEGDAQPGEPLLVPVMRAGSRIHAPAPLAELRKRTFENLERLPERLRKLESVEPYEVTIAAAIRNLADEVDRG